MSPEADGVGLKPVDMQRDCAMCHSLSFETVGGIKKVEALGALKLLSGGSASLAAVDDLH